MSDEQALFDAAVGRCLHPASYESKRQTKADIMAALGRDLEPEWRLRWLWLGSSVFLEVGEPEKAISIALEGLELACTLNDQVLATIFRLRSGAALASGNERERAIAFLTAATDGAERMPQQECDLIVSDLVQGWIAIPSSGQRFGLPRATRLLARALDGPNLSDDLIRSQCLTQLASGIIECRHLPGETLDTDAAIRAAREALELVPHQSQARASAMLLLANALCLGETVEPIAALEQARTLAQDSNLLMRDLGYPTEVDRALTTWLTIARKLAAIRRDPVPPLPDWIEDYFARAKQLSSIAELGRASLALAQYYLDDAVRGSWLALGRAQAALEDARRCRPLEHFPLEGAIALSHFAAFVEDESEADRMSAEALRVLRTQGVNPIEWPLLLRRALRGDHETARSAAKRARALLEVLPQSERHIAGLLYEVVGQALRRLGQPHDALRAFEASLRAYEAQLADAGSPVERVERIASAAKIAEEVYTLLIELGRTAEALHVSEQGKLRADSLGAALRQGTAGSVAGRDLVTALVAQQDRLASIPLSSLGERAAEVRSLQALWHRLDEAARSTVNDGNEPRPHPGTMVVFRAAEACGYAHLLPQHTLSHDPDLVLRLPDFTHERLRLWLHKWVADLCRSTPTRRHAGRPTGQVLRSIINAIGQAIFQPLVDAANRMGLDLGTVTLVPSGGLGILPLAAAKLSGDTHLCDLGRVRIVPSIEAWRRAERLATMQHDPAIVRRRLGALGITDGVLQLVDQEIAAIKSFFPVTEAACHLTGQATVDDLRKTLERSRFGHFSGHGESIGFEDPSQAGLSLGDGLASMRDLLKFDLTGSRMISLSACQTAYFGTATAPDEFLGPAFALLAAGASAVTAGLWNLEEGSSSLMHVKMYELLASGLEPLEAHCGAVAWLRRAQRTEILHFMQTHVDPGFDPLRLQERGHRPFESPGDWASFVFLGY